MDLSELLGLLCQGKITSEQMKEEVMKGGPYSNQDIAKLVAAVAQYRKEIDLKIITFLTPLSTEEIVRSNQFLLSEACNEYNISNLAKHIDNAYKTISKEPEEHRGNLLAKNVYEQLSQWGIKRSGWGVKKDNIALIAAQNIAKEYLLQKRNETKIGFNFEARKEALEKELGKIDLSKIESELKQKMGSYAKGIKREPKDNHEANLWNEKAKFLEKQGKLEEAANLYYSISLYYVNASPTSDWMPFLDFCMRSNMTDPRIIYIFNIKLKTLKDSKIDNNCLIKTLCKTYALRAKAYDFLGMTAEAQKDREARAKLLEQI